MRLLLMILVLGWLAPLCWGQTYTCRDSSGQLHFADNLQGLPEECRGNEKVVNPGKADNLNFVPATPAESGVTREFEKSVESVERELREKRETAQQLRLQSETLRERYQETLAAKRRAQRVWGYDSRDKIKQADTEIERIKSEKQRLLAELMVARMPAKERAAIREVLAEVESE